MNIQRVVFTFSRGCLVQFKDGWFGPVDIESKPLFIAAGCCTLNPLDERDRETAESLLITPIEEGRAYGYRDPVLAELAARYLVWLGNYPEREEIVEPLPRVGALLALTQFVETQTPL